MSSSMNGRCFRRRRSFARTSLVAEMPNLTDVQQTSYNRFLQYGIARQQRRDEGLQGVFESVFPIHDFSGRAELHFEHYQLEEPKHDVNECLKRGMTYAAPLKVTIQLWVFDVDEEIKKRDIRDIKEQEVYIGDIPLMTDKGTFIVNGTERVIVSQMHRSPGVFFDHDKGRTHSSGKYLFAARIIPYRGSWLDFEFDARDIVYVRIDRRRKLPATTILFALGFSIEDILSKFYNSVTYTKIGNAWSASFNASRALGSKLATDLIDADNHKMVAKAGTRLTRLQLKKLDKIGFKRRLVERETLLGSYLADDVVEASTGLVLAEAGDEIDEDCFDKFLAAGIVKLTVLDIDYVNIGPYIRNTLQVDKNSNRDEALFDIHRVMRPGEPLPTVEKAESMFRELFFDSGRYDLSAVGRVKMNARLGVEHNESLRILTKEDILKCLKMLVELKDGKGEVDDIDHLGNRRVRSVGELLENQYRMGLLRMERAIRERMSLVELDSVMPHDLVNAKPVVAAVREFFGSSQLSQFMDQTNPLSEVTHKRRLSALGPGGLTRERAGFEVRDVHPTHYGRICPVETPEGPNIGLISSLATFARVNQHGFIESPYRKVEKGQVMNEVLYLTAMQEGQYIIAQASSELDNKGYFRENLIPCRQNGELVVMSRESIDMIDVSPKQLVSVAAALIPFLENDDANRALMGSNMQRQAVPLMCTEAPLVGTGMEEVVARDSGAAIVARRSGVIDQVDAERIVVRVNYGDIEDSLGVDIYNLAKFQRSNQSTCINQRPLVTVGQHVETGDILADGSSTERGELALGKNVLCAFMPWDGYNFEDSILISERIAKDDVFTSIHIEEFEVMARDTKMGQEEITRDIPNAGEEALKNLDEAGIIYIGAEVEPDDVLVGKITPKGENLVTPEEKLLRAIFGEKASDVRDTALRVPPGVQGTVVEVRVFSRRGIDKGERERAIESEEIARLIKDRDDQLAIIERNTYSILRGLLERKRIVQGPKGMKLDLIVDSRSLKEFSQSEWWQIVVSDNETMIAIESLKARFDRSLLEVECDFENRIERLQLGDDLPAGILKIVKVFVAVKRKLQAGDKMAGRHGNKGVVSRIIPIEDMPYLSDGTPVDIVLNPLGLPSRMNVGQILETHLGWASFSIGKRLGCMLDSIQSGVPINNGRPATVSGLRKLLTQTYGEQGRGGIIGGMSDTDLLEIASELRDGIPFATPVFDGAREKDIATLLELAGLSRSGQEILIDGRTGETFNRPITVGYLYALKLHHLVDDKIHARSVGPYSLITQQPLGGKAQFGGQRFGEMEVWALQAYGAAYTLQEMLTVKSDDVAGRARVYESIVKGEHYFEAGIPESFNVLVKEIQALGLNIEQRQVN